MRQGSKEKWAQQMNHRLMSVDFHDFLSREAVHDSDVEISREMGLSIREVRELRRKMER